MAIPYEQKLLPAASIMDFNVLQWAGVNKIKGSQADYEMADCKNMCADNFPYASPRKSREKLLDESGIQRIYKVDGNRVYYIDNEGYLCYTESGAKHYLTHSEKKIQIKPCSCTNNYDEFSIFYPNIFYVDSKFEAKGITETITFIREEEQTVREEDAVVRAAFVQRSPLIALTPCCSWIWAISWASTAARASSLVAHCSKPRVTKIWPPEEAKAFIWSVSSTAT